ncbi:MAG: hypothetical protein ACLSH1_01620 [Clostridia bacterium]
MNTQESVIELTWMRREPDLHRCKNLNSLGKTPQDAAEKTGKFSEHVFLSSPRQPSARIEFGW